MMVIRRKVGLAFLGRFRCHILNPREMEELFLKKGIDYII